MTVNDETFAKVVLVLKDGREHSPKPVYFRFREHGGPVDDIQFADMWNGIDGLNHWLEQARSECQFELLECRFNFTVTAFASTTMDAMLATDLQHIGERARSRLTPLERKALGL